jgi:hypothetical protein
MKRERIFNRTGSRKGRWCPFRPTLCQEGHCPGCQIYPDWVNKIEKRREAMIKTVIRFRNDMVMVFDERGEQIPEYQGQYEKVKAGILANALPGAVFALGFTDDGELREVPRERW